MAYTIEHPIFGTALTVYPELAGVALSCTGWITRNPMVLAGGPARRGTDRLIPGAAGVRPKRRRPAPTLRTLDLFIFGHQNWDGVPYADVADGLYTNIMHMRGVFDPVGAGSPAVEAILNLPDSTDISGDVMIEGFEIGDDTGVGYVTATLDLTILSGALTV